MKTEIAVGLFGAAVVLVGGYFLVKKIVEDVAKSSINSAADATARAVVNVAQDLGAQASSALSAGAASTETSIQEQRQIALDARRDLIDTSAALDTAGALDAAGIRPDITR